MSYRIGVDIIDVRSVVGLIADDVLPEPALPNSLLAFGATAGAQFWLLMLPHERFCESFFDQPPALGEIRVAVWECPNSMDMIWQNDKSINLERVSFLDAF